MVVLSVWIKLVSKGPVFFVQERIGYRGRSFMILKFRSMHKGAETKTHERHFHELMRNGQPMVKLDALGDSRLIPLGRLIRASGLDELPQIINIIRGDMSLVGPRPCTPVEFSQYQPWQRERCNALPGLTGNWQVNGKNLTTFDEMMRLDITYTRSLSFWGDLRIMLRTPRVILQQVFQPKPPPAVPVPRVAPIEDLMESRGFGR
jgi:lipopolysaccharide/colanic/teichoic acid biosynthesis glycosyltransferase